MTMELRGVDVLSDFFSVLRHPGHIGSGFGRVGSKISLFCLNFTNNLKTGLFDRHKPGSLSPSGHLSDIRSWLLFRLRIFLILNICNTAINGKMSTIG